MAQPSNEVQGFMPWWVADYFRDTLHLSRDQHGGYMMLLGAYWTRGGPLPDDNARLAGIVKASPAEWKKLRPVLAEFFIIEDGVWKQKRAEGELEKARAYKEAQRARTAAATQARNERSANNVTNNVTLDVTKNVKGDVAKSITHQHLPSEAKASSGAPTSRRKSPAVALPSDWMPTAAHREKARSLGVSCDIEADKMRAWAQAKDARNVKWDQAFTGWLIRASQDARARIVPMKPSNGGDSRAPDSDIKARARLDAWDRGEWPRDMWGPPPDEPGCLIAPSILEQWRRKPNPRPGQEAA